MTHDSNFRSLMTQWSSLPIRNTSIPGAPLTNFNDGGGGGVRQGFIFYTQKKITTSEFVYPKKSLLFLSYPKKSQRLLWTQKNHFWPKCQTQKNHFGPTPPPPPPSLKYVSGSPGTSISLLYSYIVCLLNLI